MKATDTKDTLFAYPKKINKIYLQKICSSTGQPLGHVIDRMVECFRLNNEFVVEKKLTIKEKAALNAKSKKDFKAKNAPKRASKTRKRR